ncbi:hypothetical protein [Nonomuraea sp. B19D2]|uniref:hypothetical protein n=1 Tax=Nonomuraea sp. B19D2 TaxID=3159561 RepID=UPI0032DA0B61
MDSVTEAYIKECLDEGNPLRNVIARTPFPDNQRAFFEASLLARPLFADRSALLDCARDLADLFTLLTTLPDRLFAGDLDRYASALGIDPRRAALILRLPDPHPLYGRADLYHDGTSFKLLEYNIGSPLGGTARAETCRYLLEDEYFRRFADDHGLSYVRTGTRVAEALAEAALPVTGGAAPVIGVVESVGGIERHAITYHSIRDMLEQLGFEVVLGDVSQVSERRGRLLLRGRAIDVVLRYFMTQELVASGHDAEQILRAHENGQTVLWTSLRSELFENKGCLALLSDERWRDAFSDEERRLIDRMLPWTRRLTTGRVTVDGAEVDLVDYCREHREELIVKPFAGHSGSGIVPGWKVSDQEWERHLTEACELGHIVQRRVIPATEPVVDPLTGDIQEHEVVWGIFMTPAGYAGAHARAAPADTKAVINMGARRSVKVAPVFEYSSQKRQAR